MDLNKSRVLRGFSESLDNKLIREINVVTQVGVKSYKVGDLCGGIEIVEISKDILRFAGDPYDHYCGFDNKGNLLFSINCMAPCEIEYI